MYLIKRDIYKQICKILDQFNFIFKKYFLTLRMIIFLNYYTYYNIISMIYNIIYILYYNKYNN